MSDETLFGWIHLSDIHFGHGDAAHGWDQDLVMAALRRDIAQKPAPVRIDAVFVTGDVAFSGAGRSPDEYERARKWLLEVAEAAGVAPARIFVVPGNHDVNRSVDGKNRSVGRLVEALRSPATPRQSIDDALKDGEDRKLLASRMEKYLDFAKDFGPWVGRGALPPPEGRLYWSEALDGRGGLRLRLVGLNTALLSRDDEDFGQLRIGKEQLAKAFTADRGPDELVVVLSHHPLRKGWLGDEGYADAVIRNQAQAHLSGHVHEAETEAARSGAGGSFVRVTAGAAHNEQLPAWVPQTHGYSYGQVRREAGKVVLRIYPRHWSAPKTRFVLDVNSVPDAEGGQQPTFAEHPLAVTLAEESQEPPRAREETPAIVATTAPPVTAAAATEGPVRVFFSYAPEDEPYRKELEKHLTMLKRTGRIASFSARSVGAGGAWRGAIDKELLDARIVVLLLSTDYLASDYCYDVEMETARRRFEAGEALVIPVLVREIDVARREETKRELLWFEKLQRIPRAESGQGLADGVPVTSWPSQDAAWLAVVREIRARVDELRRSR